MAGTVWSSSTLEGSMSLTGLNLTVTSSSGTGSAKSNDFRNTGKFYFEIKANTIANGGTAPGIGSPSSVLSNYVAVVVNTGYIYANNLRTQFNIGSIVANDIICYAVDIDNQLIWIRKGAAGNWNGLSTANPVTGVGGLPYNGTKYVAPYVQINATGESLTLNSGDTAFTGSVPSGFTSGWASPGDTTAALSTQTALEVVYTDINNQTPVKVSNTVLEVWTSNYLRPSVGGGAGLLIGW